MRYHKELSFQTEVYISFFASTVFLFGIFGCRIFNGLQMMWEEGNTFLTGLYGAAFLKLAGVNQKKAARSLDVFQINHVYLL